MKNKISVCIIAKNEEENIERCLNSIKNIASEIIILDTGSTDNTKSIAEKYGKVYDYIWKNDFSDARNTCMSYATLDWIMFIDADELLLKESAEHLDNLLVLYEQTNVKAFNFRIINHMKERIIPEVYRTTIFRNNIGLHFIKPVGEYITSKDDFINIEQINNMYIVHRKEKNIDEKAIKYIDIIKNSLLEITDLKEIASSNVEIGDYYNIITDFEMADNYYRKAYETAETIRKEVSISFFENVLTRIINNQIFNLKNYSASLEFINKLRKINNRFYNLPDFIKQYDQNVIDVFCLGAYGYRKFHIEKDYFSALLIYEYVAEFFKELDDKYFLGYLNSLLRDIRELSDLCTVK